VQIKAHEGGEGGNPRLTRKDEGGDEDNENKGKILTKTRGHQTVQETGVKKGGG